MTKKQYQRQRLFKQGYIQGYYNDKALSARDRQSKPINYMRGYLAARIDRNTGETPLFPATY